MPRLFLLRPNRAIIFVVLLTVPLLSCSIAKHEPTTSQPTTARVLDERPLIPIEESSLGWKFLGGYGTEKYYRATAEINGTDRVSLFLQPEGDGVDRDFGGPVIEEAEKIVPLEDGTEVKVVLTAMSMGRSGNPLQRGCNRFLLEKTYVTSCGNGRHQLQLSMLQYFSDATESRLPPENCAAIENALKEKVIAALRDAMADPSRDPLFKAMAVLYSERVVFSTYSGADVETIRAQRGAEAPFKTLDKATALRSGSVAWLLPAEISDTLTLEIRFRGRIVQATSGGIFETVDSGALKGRVINVAGEETLVDENGIARSGSLVLQNRRALKIGGIVQDQYLLVRDTAFTGGDILPGSTFTPVPRNATQEVLATWILNRIESFWDDDFGQFREKSGCLSEGLRVHDIAALKGVDPARWPHLLTAASMLVVNEQSCLERQSKISAYGIPPAAPCPLKSGGASATLHSVRSVYSQIKKYEACPDAANRKHISAIMAYWKKAAAVSFQIAPDRPGRPYASFCEKPSVPLMADTALAIAALDGGARILNDRQLLRLRDDYYDQVRQEFEGIAALMSQEGDMPEHGANPLVIWRDYDGMISVENMIAYGQLSVLLKKEDSLRFVQDQIANYLSSTSRKLADRVSSADLSELLGLFAVLEGRTPMFDVIN